MSEEQRKRLEERRIHTSFPDGARLLYPEEPFMAGAQAASEMYDAEIAKLKDAIECMSGEIRNFVGREAQDGSNSACTYCDMGGSGRSSKGDGHHDDVRDTCPVVLLGTALAKADDILEGKGE